MNPLRQKTWLFALADILKSDHNSSVLVTIDKQEWGNFNQAPVLSERKIIATALN